MERENPFYPVITIGKSYQTSSMFFPPQDRSLLQIFLKQNLHAALVFLFMNIQTKETMLFKWAEQKGPEGSKNIKKKKIW